MQVIKWIKFNWLKHERRAPMATPMSTDEIMRRRLKSSVDKRMETIKLANAR
jgi:hypothetical protein